MAYVLLLLLVCAADLRLPGVARDRRVLANFSLGLLALCVDSSIQMLAVRLGQAMGGLAAQPLIVLTGLGFGMQVLVSFLGATLLRYWLHRLVHAVPLLWRLHRVHHSDMRVTASTCFRVHPLEAAVLLPISTLLFALMTVDASALHMALVIQFLLVLHVHAAWGLRLPVRGLWLAVLPTPQMHHVHHESAVHKANRNFSDAFPLWDILFGTFARPDEPAPGRPAYGIPELGRLGPIDLVESPLRR